jgi:penicillin-binding protein 1A
MYAFGSIDKKEYEQALVEPLSLIPKADKNISRESWFVETVNADVINAFCEKLGISTAGAKKLLYNGGLKIYTTESTAIQNILEDYFKNENNFPKEIKNGLEYSMVLTDSHTGNLLAIVGSVGNKSGDKLLNMATALHTPGSSLKPLALYAPLIDSGKINWATVFDDVPLDFISSQSGELIEYPQNYPKRYDGLINIKDAIRLSKNTVAMKLFDMLGAEEIYYNLKYNFGFDTILRKQYNDNGNVLTDLAPAPLALGQLTYGIGLRELTEAYTVFPSDGVLHKGRSFIAVLDSDGNTVIDNSPEEKRVFSKACARIMNKLLMNVTDSGTASAITIKGAIDTAGKTGTSGDDKDRLFIGYTPYVTAGIWCGYRDNSNSIGMLSVSHLGIWDDIMLSVHKQLLRGKKDHEVLTFPIDGIKRYEYCKDSGMLFSPACAKDPRGSRLEYGFFLPNDKPVLKCDRHVLCLYDKETDALATKGCPKENLTEIALIRFNGRSFPKEITVTDAEYMFYDIDGSCELGDSYDVPYFINYIPQGEYVGIGRRKKQFNSTCYLHNDQ